LQQIKIIKEMPGSVASGTPYSKFNKIIQEYSLLHPFLSDRLRLNHSWTDRLDWTKLIWKKKDSDTGNILKVICGPGLI